MFSNLAYKIKLHQAIESMTDDQLKRFITRMKLPGLPKSTNNDTVTCDRTRILGHIDQLNSSQ